MAHLRQLFGSFGFSDVETYIASGNVIFRTTAKHTTALESRIASGLQTALGFEVATFVRTDAELAHVAAYKAFGTFELSAAAALNIAFLADELDKKGKQKLMALTSDIDSFATCGREVYWLCRKRQSESTFSNAVLERTLGVRATFRSTNTVARMAAKYASEVTP